MRLSQRSTRTCQGEFSAYEYAVVSDPLFVLARNVDSFFKNFNAAATRIIVLSYYVS